MITISEEPVRRSGRQECGSRHGVQVRRRLKIGCDTPHAEDVEQVLADAWINVSDGRVLRRDEAIVPSTLPGTAR